MDINKRRIDRIKQSMLNLGINSKELAKRSGVSESTISRILSGKIIPRQKNLFAISKALHVDYVWLMGYDETNDHLIDLEKLTPSNREKLFAYYQGLVDSQEDRS